MKKSFFWPSSPENIAENGNGNQNWYHQESLPTTTPVMLLKPLVLIHISYPALLLANTSTAF